MMGVQIVAYGDEIHVYGSDDEAASVVYTVVIGANLDAIHERLTAKQWDLVEQGLGDHEIHDHRRLGSE